MTARAAGDDRLQLEDLLLPYKADDESEDEDDYVDEEKLAAELAPF